MSDKATARALATRAHPSLLEQIRPEHVHLRAYARSENAPLNAKQNRWMKGYTRFGDEMEAAFAQASGKNPRLVAESAATKLADPWMMRGMLRNEVNPSLLAVFENLRGLSKKQGARLLRDFPPPEALSIMKWLGRYDIHSVTASTWNAAISSYLVSDGMAIDYRDRSGYIFTWPELFELAHSGTSPADVRAFCRKYKTSAAGVVHHLVQGKPLSDTLDRETLRRTHLYHEYQVTNTMLRETRDGYARLLLGTKDGLRPVGPGKFEPLLVSLLGEMNTEGHPHQSPVTTKKGCAWLAYKLDDPWNMFGTTTTDIPTNFRRVWDAMDEWPGRLNMVSLLDVPLSDEDADRYIEWLDGVSSWRPGSSYTSWEGLMLSAAAAKASAFQGPFLGYQSKTPLDIDRERLHALMNAGDPISVGTAMFREELSGDELYAHIVDGIPMDYVLAMR